MPWNRLMKYMQKMFSVAEWNMSEAREREKEPRKENYAGFHGFWLCGKTNRFCLISIPLSSVAGLLEISSVVFTHISELLFFPFPCLSQSLPTVSHSGKTMMGKELLDDKDSTRSQTISLFVVWRRFMAMSFHPQTGPSSPVGCQSYFQCAVINCVCLFPWTEQENWWFT